MNTQADVMRPGRTEADRARNEALLADYDYAKYPEGLTGYSGQDRQQIALLSRQSAVRTRVGECGHYKAGMAALPDGRLVVAACRRQAPDDPQNTAFDIHVFGSADQGLSWERIDETPLYGKEPCLAALPDGSLVLTAQGGFAMPGGNKDDMPFARSEDGGRTWQSAVISGTDYPRNLIVEQDGSLLMVRALRNEWFTPGEGSPHIEVGCSRDGLAWAFEEGKVDWDYAGFGEICAMRLRNGKLLAALRRQVPGTTGEGFEDTVVTESEDDGRTWSTPRAMSNNAEVHVYLTELRDDRILATYSNYHLPWGVYAVLSEDGGRTWDLGHTIQLGLSADFHVGWPVTLQLPDDSLVTSYAATTHLMQPPRTTACEVVRWRLP